MWLAAATVGTGALGATFAAGSSDPSQSLTQWGITGVVLVGAGTVVRLLLNRINQAHEAERKSWTEDRVQLVADKAAERARAERAEGDLARLNTLVQTQVMSGMAEAQKLVSEVILMVRTGQQR